MMNIVKSSARIVTVLLTVQVAVLPVLAQQQAAKTAIPSKVTTRPTSAAAAAQIAAMQNYFKKIEKPVALPDMPEPSGAKYCGGWERDEEKQHMTAIGQRYSTKSTGHDVIEFYKAGLLANKWKLKSATNISVQAAKGDHDVCINIAPRSDVKMTCDFQISYTYKNR